MKIDFRSLSMMALRSSPGEVLDRVSRDGEVFVIERNGAPKACLVPVSFLLPDVSPDRIAAELDRLNMNGEGYKLTINERKELEISFHETAAGESVVITIVVPHGYPDAAPRIYAAGIAPGAPNTWQDGALSIFGRAATWSAKSHDIVHALALARAWLKQYSGWSKTGKWPDGAEEHGAGQNI